MTPQIVRRGHAAAALRLQLKNPQDASVAAGDLDALLARADDAARCLRRLAADARGKQLERLSTQLAHGTRPRDQPAHLIVDLLGGSGAWRAAFRA